MNFVSSMEEWLDTWIALFPNTPSVNLMVVFIAVAFTIIAVFAVTTLEEGQHIWNDNGNHR